MKVESAGDSVDPALMPAAGVGSAIEGPEYGGGGFVMPSVIPLG